MFILVLIQEQQNVSFLYGCDTFLVTPSIKVPVTLHLREIIKSLPLLSLTRLTAIVTRTYSIHMDTFICINTTQTHACIHTHIL